MRRASLIIFLAATMFAQTQTETSSIKGVVRDSATGAPIADATVVSR
jgi:hypothetical protein